MTNYEKYFGTPERVAVTFAAVDNWQERQVGISIPPDGGEWYAPGLIYLLGETVCEDYPLDPIGFLEWLEGEPNDQD